MGRSFLEYSLHLYNEIAVHQGELSPLAQSLRVRPDEQAPSFFAPTERIIVRGPPRFLDFLPFWALECDLRALMAEPAAQVPKQTRTSDPQRWAVAASTHTSSASAGAPWRR